MYTLESGNNNLYNLGDPDFSSKIQIVLFLDMRKKLENIYKVTK